MVKRSLKTNGPRFSAARMVSEYAERIYPPLVREQDSAERNPAA